MTTVTKKGRICLVKSFLTFSPVSIIVVYRKPVHYVTCFLNIPETFQLAVIKFTTVRLFWAWLHVFLLFIRVVDPVIIQTIM